MRAQRGGTAAGPGKVYVLDPARLAVGDIVLTWEPRSPVSRHAKRLTGDPFTHAAICTRAGLLMEAALRPGVRRYSILRLVCDSTAHLRVLRPQRRIRRRSAVVARAAGRAEWMLDRPFWRRGALAFLLAGTHSRVPLNPSEGFFCAQLVATAYKAAGLALLPGVAPHRTAPAALLRSRHLDDVTARVLRREDKRVARIFALTEGEFPHSAIEREADQALLACAQVRRIVAAHRRRRARGFYDLLHILAGTRDRRLDRIVAATVAEVERAYEEAFGAAPPASDRFLQLLLALRAGALTGAEAAALGRALARVHRVLQQDAEDRARELAAGARRLDGAGTLATFRTRRQFAEHHLRDMRGQCDAVAQERALLAAGPPPRQPDPPIGWNLHNCLLLLEHRHEAPAIGRPAR